MFIYSGHGTNDNIKLCDGNEYVIQRIITLFDNANLKSLRGMPKIFMFDCCRGSDQEDSGYFQDKRTKKKTDA